MNYPMISALRICLAKIDTHLFTHRFFKLVIKEALVDSAFPSLSLWNRTVTFAIKDKTGNA